MTIQKLPRADLEHVLAHTEGVWESIRGARLFITGGTGFVGKWLLESFIHANQRHALDARAVVLSRDPQAFAATRPDLAGHRAISLVPGDIRDFQFPPGEFSHTIHGATDVVATAAPVEMFDSTVGGTRRVLEFCEVRGVAHLLLLSSGAVYGRQPPDLQRVGENFLGAPPTTDPKMAYGEGKRAAEWLACAFSASSRPSARIARCFAFVGPYLALDKQFAIGNFMRDAMAGNSIRIMGDGTPLRSYLYAADMAAWLWTILLRGAPGHAYNVGSDAEISIHDLAQEVMTVAGRDLPLTVAGQPQPGVLPERYVPDITQARQVLGLDVWIPLTEAIARTMVWHQEAMT
jgi:nucleoside-diphosphate-sugar epimerase